MAISIFTISMISIIFKRYLTLINSSLRNIKISRFSISLFKKKIPPLQNLPKPKLELHNISSNPHLLLKLESWKFSKNRAAKLAGKNENF